MATTRSSKRSDKPREPSPLMVRLDADSKAYLARAAELRRISVSDYVRTRILFASVDPSLRRKPSNGMLRIDTPRF